jgi:hypothetical protein
MNRRDAMVRRKELYVKEFSNLVTVEQHLLNAAGTVRVVASRLGGESRQHEDLQELLRALEDAVDRTRRTKRSLLREWRSSSTPADHTAGQHALLTG